MSRRTAFPTCAVDEEEKRVVGIGPELALEDPFEITRVDGVLSVYPVDAEGNHRVWRYGRDTMLDLIGKGEIRVGKYNAALDTYTLNHLKPVPKFGHSRSPISVKRSHIRSARPSALLVAGDA